MDITAVSAAYANPFYPQNFAGETHQQQHSLHQIYHGNYVVSPGAGLGSNHNGHPGSPANGVLSPRSLFGDLYRFENGGGDASGSMMLGQDDDDDDAYCDEGGAGGEENEAMSGGAMSPSSSVAISTTSSCPEAVYRNIPQLADISGMGEMEKKDDQKEAEEQVRHYVSELYPRTTDEYLPRLPLPRPCAFMTVGQEQYVIQPDTIFVLGMRLNVTKNDIIMFFGKLGLIKMDEATNKPKIFVYKNKLTGRSKGEATITYMSPYSAQAALACLGGSKFMGQTLTVLPAYLSTRKGSVRFSYPREMNPVDQQRRQRQQKWKPASDNWVCSVCRNSNFVWRSSCNRCQASKRTSTESGADSPAGSTPNSSRRWRPLKSDWQCGFCFNLNFWYRMKCNRCRAPRSDAFSRSDSEKEHWELVLSQVSNE
ncbi:hypothetical protein KR009_002357 [Drosophila setifemur]|nr:hypothetical protein KR009_002357 [Drosophila setifemur]